MRKKHTYFVSGLLAVGLLLGLCSPAIAAVPEHDGYLVQFKEGVEMPAFSDTLSPLHEASGLYLAEDTATVASLSRQGLLEYAEPNGMAVLLEGTPDPFAEAQWYLDELGVSAAWDADLNGQGITVAIIDSGLNANHEDFVGAKILPGRNLLNNSTDVTDTVGHGTFVTGLLVAQRDNGIGISGLVDEAAIVPFKCFSTGNRTNVSYIVSAIYAAVDTYDCDVINLSLGAERNTQALTDAVRYAEAHNVIIVSAVGNDGGTDYVYPAADDSVVGVGSVGPTLAGSSFSQHNDSVLVVAPGEAILSLDHTTYSGYSQGKGTSFSAPFVTAMAVMAKTRNPDMTGKEFMALLTSTARDLGPSGYDIQYGYGLVDVESFVSALLNTDTPHLCSNFTDIRSHWAQPYICFVVEEGLMNGVTATTFSPDTTLTRGMMATILYRMHLENGGEALTGGIPPFSDVEAQSWYADAICWAAQNGIVNGMTDTLFMPLENISREQMAAMLYRYSQFQGQETAGDPTALDRFSDSAKIASYAREAMAWAVSLHLITGMTEDSLSPQTHATRAQTAAVFQRLLNLS